jgi:hypothetical protein
MKSRLTRVLLATVVACAVGGCQWLLDPSPEQNGPQVAVVGDSITVLANPYIRADVEPTHALVGNAITGARIADMLPWLQGHVSDSPIIVENLGTNDIDHSDWQSAESSLLNAVAGSACVELVTIHNGAASDRAAFNANLANAAAANANEHVMDWAAAVDADPTLVFDGVHPSDKGSQWLGNAYASAIANDCSTSISTTTSIPDTSTTSATSLP